MRKVNYDLLTGRLKHIWCLRKGKDKGFWLKIEVCIAIQSNPDKRCPKTCKEKENK